LLVQQLFDVQKYSAFINKQFIPFYAESEEETGEALEQRFHIGGGPSVALVNADGSLYDILTNFKDSDTYLERLKKALKGIDTYASLKAKYDSNPRDLKLMYTMADKHFRMWQTDKSVAYCNKILDRREEAKNIDVTFQGIDINLYEIARYGVASTVWWTEQSPRGMEDFKTEFSESKLMSKVDANLAGIYMELPVSEKTKTFFGSLVSAYPDDPMILTQYMRFAVENSWDLEKAESVGQKLIVHNPDDLNYKHFTTQVLLKQNKTEELSAIFGEDFIKKHMDNTRILNSYAWFWALEEQNLKSALKAIQTAAKLDPQDANLLDTMSMVCWKMKDYAMAIKIEEKANRMNPNPAYVERIDAIKIDMAQKN
jgi:tetratricopeptide (TPR) repeat protein